MTRPQTSHPLDPLSAAEISVAVATVRAAGATPEVANFYIMPLFCCPPLYHFQTIVLKMLSNIHIFLFPGKR